MTIPSVFELCRPREDVEKGTIADSDYAANLANVVTGRASRDYTDAPTFFTNTYPTEGLKLCISLSKPISYNSVRAEGRP